MALQDLGPVNPELIDTLVTAAGGGWLPTGENASIKVLWTGAESGSWAALFRWGKGYEADAHKHLSDAHTYILKGRLQVRDGVLEAGDYLYEANGMIHEKTAALEDTEYLFICNGPLVFFDREGLTHYIGWEEMERMRVAAA